MPSGDLHPEDDSALGAFKDPSLLETVFPGLLADITRNLAPAAEDVRIIDIDYCVNGSAIHHLGPLEDVFVREWTPEGTLAAMTLAIGRFAKSAFAAKAADIPVLRDKLTYILDGLAVARTRTSGAKVAPSSTTSRSASCSTQGARICAPSSRRW